MSDAARVLIVETDDQATIEPPAHVTSKRQHRNLVVRVLRRPAGIVSVAILVVVIVVSVLGPLIAPYDPNKGSLLQVLLPPSPSTCWVPTTWDATPSPAYSSPAASRCGPPSRRSGSAC